MAMAPEEQILNLSIFLLFILLIYLFLHHVCGHFQHMEINESLPIVKTNAHTAVRNIQPPGLQLWLSYAEQILSVSVDSILNLLRFVFSRKSFNRG